MNASFDVAPGSSRSRRVAVLLVASAAAATDLIAKAVSKAELADTSVDLGPLELRLSYNPGVAFSMGDQLPTGVVVTATALIAAALVAYAWRRAPDAGRVEQVAGGAAVGGAVANVIDRARDGVVTDYLHTGWWPTFNLADAYLVCGFTVITLLLLRRPDESATSAEERHVEPPV